MRIDTSGNVGIGTTAPLARLHVEGQCVTGDTLLKRRRRRRRRGSGDQEDTEGEWEEYWEDIRIDEIQAGDEILTLDETTGQFISSKINGLMDMGEQKVFELATAGGKTIQTTANHPYFAVTKQPFVFVDETGILSTDGSSQMGVGALRMSGNLSALNRELREIFLSMVNSYKNADEREFELKFTFIKRTNIQFYQQILCVLNKYQNQWDFSYFIEKQSKTSVWKHYLFLLYRVLRAIPGKYTVLADYLNQPGNNSKRIESLEIPQIANILQLESQGSMFLQIVDILLGAVAFNQSKGKSRYRAKIAEEVQNMLKQKNRAGVRCAYAAQKSGMGLLRATSEQSISLDMNKVKSSDWVKVGELHVGMEIATIDGYEVITSIKEIGIKKTYDIEVADTHNFVANEIVAHNTYLRGDDQLNTSFALRIADSTSADRFVVTNSGNVGIGTTNPSQGLHVSGKRVLFEIDNSLGLEIYRPNSTVGMGAELGMSFNNASGTKFQGTSLQARLDDNTAGAESSSMQFRTRNAGTLAERMRLFWNGGLSLGTNYVTTTPPANGLLVEGNVGIGTTSPGAKLHVAGSNSYGISVIAGASKAVRIGADTTGGLVEGVDYTGFGSYQPLRIGGSDLRFMISNVEKVRIDANGNMGIGTTGPGEKLDVSGTIRSNYEYSTSVSFPAGFAINDYREFVQATTSGAGASGNFIITIDAARSNFLAESSTYQIATDHANANVWREAAVVNDNSYVGGARCFTVDVNGNGSAPKFRVRAIRASISCGTDETTTVYVKVRSEGRNLGWTAISGSGAGGSVTGVQSSVGNSWNLYTGNPYSGAGVHAISAIANGSVGIGTTSPTTELDVVGTVNATQVNSNSFVLNGETFIERANPPGDLTLLIGDFNDGGWGLQLWSGFNQTMTLDTSGNVGIGTTNPEQKLHVEGWMQFGNTPRFHSDDGSFTFLPTTGNLDGNLNIYPSGTNDISRLRLYGANNSTTDYTRLDLFQDGSHTYLRNQAVAGGTAGDFYFQNAGTSLMTIKSTGNVGIGTTAPGAKLDIAGGSVLLDSDQFLYGNTADVNGNAIRLYNGSTGDMGFTIGYPTGAYTFTTGGSERVRIKSDGNVGIGTTSPAGALDVVSANFPVGRFERTSAVTTSSRGILKLLSTTSGNMADGFGGVLNFEIKDDAGVENAIAGIEAIRSGADNSGTLNLRVYNAGTSSSALTVLNTGNVGIGTTAPNKTFHVFGNSKLEYSSPGANSLASANYGLTLKNPDTTTNNLVGFTLDSNDSLGNTHTFAAIGAIITDHTDGAETADIIFNSRVAGTLAERMRIKNGNVGIGTTAPGYKLDLKIADAVTDYFHLYDGSGGEIYLGDSTNDNTKFQPLFGGVIKGSNKSFILLGSASSGEDTGTTPITVFRSQINTPAVVSTRPLFQWQDYTSPVMTIDNAGNVGIGTTGPSEKLDVYGNIYSSYGQFLGLDNGATNPSFSFKANANTGMFRPTANGIGFALGGTESVRLVNNGIVVGSSYIGTLPPTGGMIISGNVGIGTTSPSQLFDVSKLNSGGVGAIAQLTNPASVTNTAVELRFAPSSSFANRYASIQGVSVADTDNHIDLAFLTGDGSVINEKMRIKYNGNVGIGTTAPGAKLEVANLNPGTVSSVRVTGYSGNYYTDFITDAGGSGNSNINFQSAGASPLMNFQMNGGTKVTIDKNGNVGIGTTDPGAYKLYVAGNAYATGTWGSSDIRWKQNINPIANALEKIVALQGVTFDWNKEAYPDMGFSGGNQIGLIAQQVEQIVPQLVSTNTNGYKAIEYSHLTALLVEGVKEQQVQINGLSGQMMTLSELYSSCVTGETMLPIRRKRRKKNANDSDSDDDESYDYLSSRIDEILPRDEVLSLNEDTGELEYAKILALMDKGIHEVYELTTRSGKTITTTGNHPF